MAEGEHRLRCVKGFARLKNPLECKRVDAILHAYHPVRSDLRAADMVAGINKVEAPALARLLAAIHPPDSKKRIVPVGACAADGANRTLPRRKRPLMFIALTNPRAVKGEHGILPGGQVNLHAHQGMKFDLPLALIDQTRAAGDHIAFLKHRVEQVQLRAERRILKDYRQRLAPAIAGGQAGKLRLRIGDPGGHKFEIGVKIPVFRLHLKGGQPVIPLAEFRILQPDMIERELLLFIIDRRLAVARSVLIIEEGIRLARRDFSAIIELLKLAAGQRTKEIAGFFRR